MIWIENTTFKDRDIKLDFTSWKKCDFINCNIIVEYGIYDLVECEFSGCRLSLSGGAQSIIKVCKLFYPIVPIGEDFKNPVYIKQSLDWLHKCNPEAVHKWIESVEEGEEGN